MKFTKTAVFISFFLLQGCNAYRHNTANEIGKITVTSPDAVKYLPGFPAFDDKDAFFNDSIMYERGFAMRDSERGRQAIDDASIQLDFYHKRFGEVMGVNISEENTPAIANYLKATHSFAGKSIVKAKGSYSRERPFSYFGEPSSIPKDEEKYGAYTSYPSGHSIGAWIIALSLTAIDNEHECEIIRVGYELGQSRVITGFHYQSDVEAGRLAASVVFAKIVSDEEYIKLMNLARKELQELRSK